MASFNILCADTQIYRRPALGDRTGKWTKGHSVTAKNGRMYHGNTYDTGGGYNGNMATYMWFNNLCDEINSKKDKITKITLHLSCMHCYYSSGATVHLNYTGYSGSSGSDSGVVGKTGDDRSSLGVASIGNYKATAGNWTHIDITNYKTSIANGTIKGFALYTPGAYNVSSLYAYFGGDGEGTAPYISVEYTPNSAPYAPTVEDTRPKAGGWGSPSLTFKVASNGDPDGNLSNYSYQIRNKDNVVITSEDWVTNNEFSYNVGDAYRGSYVNIVGQVKDTGGLAASSSKFFYINRRPYWTGNKDIYFSSPVFKDILSFSWDKADDDDNGQSIIYNVYYRINDASTWSSAATNLTSCSHSINFSSSMANGDKVKILIAAYDGVEEPNNPKNLESQWIYKDVPPAKPSNITPASGHFESDITVRWTAVISELAGVTISKYVVNLLREDGSVIQTYNPTTNSLTITNLESLVSRGYKFKFKVVAVDSIGKSSEGGFSNLLVRNHAPNAPSIFKTAGTSLHFQNTIPLTWNAGTDEDKDDLTYKIWYQINGGTWTLLVDNLDALTFNHNVKAYSAKTNINYKIKSKDSFGIESPTETYISYHGKIVINTPPEKPTLMYPIVGKNIYNKRPRLAFKINTDDDSDLQILYVTINGTEYNSETHGSMFAVSKSASDTKTIFIPSKDFNIGTNSVAFHTSDGMSVSGTTTININVIDSSLNIIGDTEDRFVKANDINELRTMINAARPAYGLTVDTFTDTPVVANKTYIKSIHFNEMLASVFDMNKVLNDWTPTLAMKRNYTMPNIVPNQTLELKEHFNQILKMILIT